MCVHENNVPTNTYIDEPCEGDVYVNIYKPYTTKQEIQQGVEDRIAKKLFTTCEKALTLQGLTGSESLTGHACLGTLIKKEIWNKDSQIAKIELKCVPFGTNMFGSMECDSFEHT